MPTDAAAIYDPAHLKRLFDEMQSSYDRVCSITSFGFNLRWRRQLIARLALERGMAVGDLMAGGGETWRYLLARVGGGRILAVTSRARWSGRRADASASLE
jgi:demethylmenaquinone methyltransferase/2-methoxy-6-polyprenyl-1,4-benzoquinol methylase